MRKRLDDAARAAVHAVGAFLASIVGAARDWVASGDVSLLVVLGVAAVVLLFVMVPNHRRY